MNRKIGTYLLIVICLVYSCKYNSPSERKLDMRAYEKKKTEIFGKFKKSPVPLEKVGSFPFKEETILEAPRKIVQDKKGNIYILDTRACCIHVFNPDGHFTRKIGRSGQAPHEFLGPIDMDILDEKILVNDLHNGRIKIFNLEGELLNSFIRMREYFSIRMHPNDIIYASPLGGIAGSAEIDKLSHKGELLGSLGEEKFGRAQRYLNNTIIAIDNEGDIYLAYSMLSKINKFRANQKGKRTIQIDHSQLKNNEMYNLERKNASYRPVIDGIKCADNKIFLLINSCPCLQVIQLNTEGGIEEIFFWDKEIQYVATDFIPVSREGSYGFYIIQIFPDIRIDYFSKK